MCQGQNYIFRYVKLHIPICQNTLPTDFRQTSDRLPTDPFPTYPDMSKYQKTIGFISKSSLLGGLPTDFRQTSDRLPTDFRQTSFDMSKYVPRHLLICPNMSQICPRHVPYMSNICPIYVLYMSYIFQLLSGAAAYASCCCLVLLPGADAWCWSVAAAAVQAVLVGRLRVRSHDLRIPVGDAGKVIHGANQSLCTRCLLAAAWMAAWMAV